MEEDRSSTTISRTERTGKVTMSKLSLLFGLLLMAGKVFASVEIQISSRTVTVGDSLELSLSVSGGLDEDIRIPSVPGMEAASSGKSTNMSIINGRMERKTVYSYRLTFSQVGKVVIPSFNVLVDGKNYTTKPIEVEVRDIEVLDRDSVAKSKPLFFVERTLSNETPYVSEPVIETIKVYKRVNWRGANRFQQDNPELKYFEVPGQNESREVIDGVTYGVTTLKRVFVPLKEGEMKLGRMGVDIQYVNPSQQRRRDPFDFFGGVPLANTKVAAPEILLGVNSLPTDNRPSGFSGFVGDADLKVNLSSNKLKTGETATLTIRVEGTGWMSSLNLKEPKFNPSILKVYPDKPQTTEEPDGRKGLVGSKELNFAIVPVQEGTFDLGKYSFSYFDPKKREYVTKTVELGVITVEKGESTALTSALPSSGDAQSGGGFYVEKSDVKKIGSDIFDLKRDVRTGIDTKFIGLFAFLCSVLVMIWVAVVEFDLLGRFYKSSKTTRENLKKLYSDVVKALRRSSVDGVYAAFQVFMANERNLSKTAVTYNDMARYFQDKGYAESELLSLLRREEERRYGARHQSPDFEKNRVVAELKRFCKG